MIKLPPSEETQDHKMQKTCIICREMPEYSKLYRCNMGGHLICYSCFTKLPKTGGARCTKCNSVILKIQNTHVDLNQFKKKPITVEDLFQLPSEQVNLLLNRSSQEKLENNRNTSYDNVEIASVIKKNHQANAAQIYKPIKCPQTLCAKSVNCLSLKEHFMHEHSNLNTHLIKRGEELHIVSNASVIEHSINHCIDMIEIYDEYKFVSRVVNGIYKQDIQKISVATFWIMVTGSRETRNSRAYALYWLVTDSELPFKCTLEISSPDNNTSCATFCGVNDVRDDLCSTEIASRMNCLYLCYGSILNVKGIWGELNLGITIH